jgi:hypothetical protein
MRDRLLRHPVFHFWPAFELVAPYVWRSSGPSQILITAQTALVLARRPSRLRANVSIDRLLRPEVGTCGLAI